MFQNKITLNNFHKKMFIINSKTRLRNIVVLMEILKICIFKYIIGKLLQIDNIKTRLKYK